MKWWVTTVALVLGLVLANGCGGSTRDPVADARTSFDRVQRGTVHMEVELAGSANEPAARAGFAADGTFDLAPAGAVRPATDVTTVNLGVPDQMPSHFVSTGRDAFVVQGDVGYQLATVPVSPPRPALDLQKLLIDPTTQSPTSTAAGESVDRVTGHVDPVDAVNGVVDLADHLGAGPDAALRVSVADADRVRRATTSSTVEVLTGHDDHLLRGMTAHIELAAPVSAPSAPPAGPTTGGALVQALHKLGHVSVTVQVRLDDPNAPVIISPPPTIRPISELGRG